MNLLYNSKLQIAIKGQSSAAASTGHAIDMSGFEGVLFILHGSSLMVGSSNLKLRAKGCASTTGTFVFYQPVAQSTKITTGTFNYRIQALDLYKPLKRYVKACITGSSSDLHTPFTVTALQYGCRYPGSTNLRDSTHLGGVTLAVGATSS